MRRRTVATLFGGGGGWDVGAVLAGWTPLWSVEWDPEIAAVQAHSLGARVPGHRTIVGDVRTVGLAGLAAPDVLLASPVCKAHSKATSRIKAEVCDLEHAWSGTATLRFVEALAPRVVVLENAADYPRHPSFRQIAARLAELGYAGHTATVDACWFGTPSHRLRMLSVWTLGAPPPREVFAKRPCAVSWYEAVRDLVPTFPRSHLAPWQVARIERMVERGFRAPFPWLVSSNNVKTSHFAAGKVVNVAYGPDQPGFALVATLTAQGQLRVLEAGGDVRTVTPRGYARMMGFPDWYELPASRALATKAVGNAVPPPMSAAVLRALAPRV